MTACYGGAWAAVGKLRPEKAMHCLENVARCVVGRDPGGRVGGRERAGGGRGVGGGLSGGYLLPRMLAVLLLVVHLVMTGAKSLGSAQASRHLRRSTLTN
eukprot:4335364-Prymnesium_polylepis.1